MLARPQGPMDARWPLVIGSTLLSLALAGCMRGPSATTQIPAAAAAPDLAAATDQARCSVRRSADRPLVVEWPAADRAALEARARQGLVAVRYEGCTMEVLSHCEIDGRYDFVALSPKQERVSIRSADELYARLPVGAAALEGKLERSGELTVDMSIVGRKQADRHVIAHDELEGRCDRATHVLTGLTVGAFTLSAASETEAGARVRVGQAGAGGAHERGRELLTRDGDPLACGVPVDAERHVPPPGCGALLRVEAVPLVGQAPAVTEAVAAAASVAEHDRLQLQQHRAARRSAAWRGVAIGSGVLSGASLGGIVGGVVMMARANDFAVWEEPTPEQARQGRVGTGLLVGSSIGFVGFGALALGASAAAGRGSAWNRVALAPTLGRTGAGLQLRGRF
ncbi:MAG: hypothetical protein AB1Z98_40205 [Nannocystaceae bacterium]